MRVEHFTYRQARWFTGTYVKLSTTILTVNLKTACARHHAMDLVTITQANGIQIVVSAIDVDRVAPYKWYVLGQYLFCQKLQVFLHHHIIGARPSDVPEDYVVDHANRQKFDVSRPNLRWVTCSFNVWNRDTPRSSTNPYKGVRLDKNPEKSGQQNFAGNIWVPSQLLERRFSFTQLQFSRSGLTGHPLLT